MSKQLQDKIAIIQVLGAIFKKPSLLSDARYPLDGEDFVEPFHELLFSIISNLYNSGVNNIRLIEIKTYLKDFPVQSAIYEQMGDTYISNMLKVSELDNFDYYYLTLKKYTLIRMAKTSGFDISDFFNAAGDFNSLDGREKFETSSLDELVAHFANRVFKLNSMKIGNNDRIKNGSLSNNINELIDELLESPEFGLPAMGDIFSTVVRGSRPTKIYMTSAPTGAGKTRRMVGNCCKLGAKALYRNGKWVQNPSPQSTLYITTELAIDEVQTMFLANVSGVQEEHILDGKYLEGELDRVRQAAAIIKESNMFITQEADFDFESIEQIIRDFAREHGVKYIYFDYIHSTMKLLFEAGKSTNGVKLREDLLLLLFITRLKDIANDLDVYIETSSQLNRTWEDGRSLNQNALRGATSLGDKLDYGGIMVKTTAEDIEIVNKIIADNNYPIPNIVTHVYKNRRGKFNDVKIWSAFDHGTCILTDLFITDKNDNLITDFQIYIANVGF